MNFMKHAFVNEIPRVEFKQVFRMSHSNFRETLTKFFPDLQKLLVNIRSGVCGGLPFIFVGTAGYFLISLEDGNLKAIFVHVLTVSTLSAGHKCLKQVFVFVRWFFSSKKQ